MKTEIVVIVMVVCVLIELPLILANKRFFTKTKNEDKSFIQMVMDVKKEKPLTGLAILSSHITLLLLAVIVAASNIFRGF